MWNERYNYFFATLEKIAEETTAINKNIF